MIQATGLSKAYRRSRAPALLDLTFEAHPGRVTTLLGPEDAGKSTAVRLMLGLERGRGSSLFSGHPYRSIRCPEREVGVVLEAGRDRLGHPGRRARSHLRMLAAAVGAPTRRADHLLEQVRLDPMADHRLRSFSPGMLRRLALATALLGDPAALVLDAPMAGLSAKNAAWFRAFLRAFAVSGGTVLLTCRDPREAAALADRVVTLECGRLAADQPVQEFVRTRLHPEVAVCGPQVGRLADLLRVRGAEVRREGGAEITVGGLARTEIGEIAYRHGILLHQLADRVVEQPAPRPRSGTVVSPALPSASGRSRVVPAAIAAATTAAATAAASVRDPTSAAAAGGDQTVVVLSPRAAVVATVVGPLCSDHGPAPAPLPLFRDEADPPARERPLTRGSGSFRRRGVSSRSEAGSPLWREPCALPTADQPGPALPEPPVGAETWSK